MLRHILVIPYVLIQVTARTIILMFVFNAEKRNERRKKNTYLLPHCSPTPQAFVTVLLWFGLIDFDHAAVEFGLVHVVDCFASIFCEREFDVAETAVGVFV